MATEWEVIQAVLQGQSDRYAELVDRYQGATIKLAFSFVGNYEDARELSQNGFVKAYQHLRDFRGKAKFSTWLYRIVVNECKDFLKRMARQPRAVTLAPDPDAEGSELFEVPEPSRGPRGELEQRELARQVTQAIQELPMKQQTAFVLHHVQGLSMDEVAGIMGCRVGTVKAHVFRATQHLRDILEPFVTTPETQTWTQTPG